MNPSAIEGLILGFLLVLAWLIDGRRLSWLGFFIALALYAVIVKVMPHLGFLRHL